MRELIFANPWYKLISFLLALAAWAYVQSQTVAPASITAELVWTFPPGLAPTQIPPRGARVQIRGVPLVTRPHVETSPTIALDVSTYEAGQHAVSLRSHIAAELGTKVEVVDVSPSNIDLTLDEIHRRKLSVNPVIVGEVADGFEVDSIRFDPQLAEVEGPRKTLLALDRLNTLPLDVSGLTRSTKIPVRLDLPKTLEAVGSSIEARIEVAAMFEQRVLGQVPVMVFNVDGFVTSTDTVEVTLEGPSGALRALPREQVVAFVHLPEDPIREQYQAYLGPKDGVRIQVLHPASGDVRAVSVQPAMITVRKTP